MTDAVTEPVLPRQGSAKHPNRVGAVAIVLVFVGGTVGTAARAGLVTLGAPLAPPPVATMTINIVGAFLLGVLLEFMMVRPGGGGGLRLLLGTGVLGGFTTYSALAVDTAGLTLRDHPWTAVGYAVGTVFLGAISTTGGILLASKFSGARSTFFRPRRRSMHPPAKSE